MQQVIHLLFRKHLQPGSFHQNSIQGRSHEYEPEIIDRFKKSNANLGINHRRYYSIDYQVQKMIMQGSQNNAQSTRMKSTRKIQLEQSKKEQLMFIQKQQGQGFQLPKIGDRHNGLIARKNSINTSTTKSSFKQNSLFFAIDKVIRYSKKNKKKLRLYVQAIIFIRRLKRKVIKKVILIEKMTYLSQNLTNIIFKSIKKFYDDQLREPLICFAQIANKKIVQGKKYNPTKDIVINLINISEGLKNIKIKRDAVKFITYVTLDQSPLPCDFFCEFELLRLDFSTRKFQLKNINEAQIKMITGMFLIIKLLCKHLFTQPWNISFLNIPEGNQKKLVTIINAYTSYFISVVTSFYEHLPCLERNNLLKLTEKGVVPMKIQKKNSQFYQTIAVEYQTENIRIINNLSLWIDKITDEVLKNRIKLKQQY